MPNFSSWPPASANVFVGFPDSSPSNASALASSPSGPLIPVGGNAHGYNLAWLSRLLTCQNLANSVAGSPACYTTPITELGIDAFDAGRAAADAPRSGTGRGAAYGSRTGFARSIKVIVDRWRTSNSNQHLIINIAAGWEPTFECAQPLWVDPANPNANAAFQSNQQPKPTKDVLPMTPSAQGLQSGTHFQYPVSTCSATAAQRISRPSQEVYDALRLATCAGAVVIAAVGNDPGGALVPTGALLPAGWEVMPAPDAPTCRALGFPRPPTSEGRPLVHAVYGVDENDLPILVSRRDSRSKLAAPASLLVGYPDIVRDGYVCADGKTPPCLPSAPMTGTSVAATVVSSVAAAVWAKYPNLTAAQLMDNVYATGVSLSQSSNFGFGGAEQPMHRVSLCNALTCEDASTGACVTRSGCEPRPAYRGGSAPATFSNGITERRAGATLSGGAVSGQPVNPCPACFLRLNFGGDSSNPEADAVIGQIEPQFFDDTGETSVGQPSVSLFNSSQRNIGSFNLTPGGPYVKRSTPEAITLTYSSTLVPASAVLSWLGGSGQVYTQEIPVYQ
ncbi:MAG: S8 family serine peptidase [Polyangiaceae bacterium]|nr:S8 family serine peptidase [Polyangiaceae bacterium]